MHDAPKEPWPEADEVDLSEYSPPEAPLLLPVQGLQRDTGGYGLRVGGRARGWLRLGQRG